MINFCKYKKWYLLISLVIFIVGIAFIFINGVQLDIQFTGGTKITYSYTGELDTDAAGVMIQKSTKRIVSTQKSTGSVDGTNSLVVSLAGKESLSTEELEAIDAVVLKEYSGNKIARQSTTNVEPYIGNRFLRNGIMAVVIAIILIVIFVTIRFKIISGFTASVCALIALFHDVFVVFFVSAHLLEQLKDFSKFRSIIPKLVVVSGTIGFVIISDLRQQGIRSIRRIKQPHSFVLVRYCGPFFDGKMHQLPPCHR